MAERYQKKTVLNFKQAPDYQSRAHAQVQQSWQQVGQVANQVSKVAFKFLENEVAADAKVAGMLAGQKKEGGLQTGWSKNTTYGQSYNTAFVAAYGAEIALEANEKITEYSMLGEGPDAFKQRTEGYRKTLVNAVQDPALQGLINSKVDQYFGPAYKTMVKAEYQAKLDDAIYLNKKGLRQTSDDAVHAFDVAGNELNGQESAEIAQTQFLALINAGVHSPDPLTRISEEVADELTKDYFYRKALAVRGGQNFEAALRDGDGYEWIQTISEWRPKDDNLTEEQHTKLVGQLHKKLNIFHKQQDREKDAREDAAKELHEDNFIDNTLNRDSLTLDKIDEQLRGGELSTKGHAALEKVVSDNEDDEDDLSVSELLIDLMADGPEGIRERVVALGQSGAINSKRVDQLLTALDGGKFQDPTSRRAYSNAQSLLKDYFTITGPMGSILGGSGKTHARNVQELFKRVEKGEDPMEVAFDMIKKADDKAEKQRIPDMWTGDLKSSTTALVSWMFARYPGVTPEKIATDGLYHTEWKKKYEELLNYDQELKRKEVANGN
jgi:hypothetical protein